MKIFRFLLLAFMLLTLTGLLEAQTHGKLYSKEEADAVYGAVISSIPIKTAELQQLINRAGDEILFNILDNKLVILGKGRKALYPAGFAVDKETVFMMYSVSVVKELLDKGKDETTKVEKRKDVLSLTNGAYTMEFASCCPPICD